MSRNRTFRIRCSHRLWMILMLAIVLTIGLAGNDIDNSPTSPNPCIS